MSYPGFNLTKTLEGRDMNSGEFAFAVVAENPYAAQKAIACKDDPLVFESCAHASGEACIMPGVLADLTFNQDDSNHELIYLVEEVLPADDDPVRDGVQQNGVTYDETQHRVVIRPTDDGEGRIVVTTEVYDINDDLRENLLSFGSSDEDTTAVVPFANKYVSNDADSADPVEPADPAAPAPGDASASEDGVADGGVKDRGASEASFAKTNDSAGMLVGALAVAICAAAAFAALALKRRHRSF